MEGSGEREIIYLSLHCHHQNDSCIKMGRGESHFNVPLIVRDKVTRQCGETTIFEEKGEPKRIRTKVPLLTARPKRLTDSQVHDSGPLTATFIAGGGYTPPVARITCLFHTPVTFTRPAKQKQWRMVRRLLRQGQSRATTTQAIFSRWPV